MYPLQYYYSKIFISLLSAIHRSESLKTTFLMLNRVTVCMPVGRVFRIFLYSTS